MRVLTVRQPWATAIISGEKTVENRRQSLGPYRGPVAILAGKRLAPITIPQERLLREVEDLDGWFDGESIVGGAILGVVDLVETHHATQCWDRNLREAARLYAEDRSAFYDLPVLNDGGGIIGRTGFCSPWAEDEAWHLTLANARPLADPLPYTGALGLKHLPDDVAAVVMSRVNQEGTAP